MKLLKNIFSFLGYDIKKINKETSNINFDDLLRDKIPNNPVILDVGGNKGQSIERFIKIFDNPTIHSFEPIKKEYEYMKEKFKGKNNIILNNFAIGEKKCIKEFNITAKTGNSSFNRIRKDTKWLKVRSKEHNIPEEDYIIKKEKISIETLDDYIKDHNLEKIDLLKVDTQGYEDKVFEGTINNLKNKKVGAVITEIMFDDVYSRYLSFSDIEKYLVPNNFRMVGIDLANNNLFSGLVFFADVYYLNKDHHNL